MVFAVSLLAERPERTLAPRHPANKKAAKLPPQATVDTIVIKFQEGSRVRLRGRNLAALARDGRETAKLAKLGLTPAQIEGDLHTVQSLLASHKVARGRGLERQFDQPEEELAAWRASGEERSGRELADLDLYYHVRVPEGTTQADVDQLVDTLNTLPSVEIAYASGPPKVAADISPTTPNFQPNQGYLGPAPNGINALYAWTVPGGSGASTKIVDVEGAWVTTHEDMPPMFRMGGTQINTPIYRNHGTAVMGVLAGLNNGYGVTGIAHSAQVGYDAIGNRTTASAITAASAAVGVSGLVLIELHQQGPTTPNSSCNCAGDCDFVPMEWWQANYDAIAAATANGRIVVEAGGNGATDLDDWTYNNAFNRWYRDSGAILVGAGLSSQRSPSCFTNFGSRIDMHGWGNGVMTLGYNDMPGWIIADERQWYTGSFGGTSSASPIVTGAAASIIGVSLANGQGYGGRTPAEIRQILKETGTPQLPGDSRYIGPMPNLAAAIPRILDRRPVASFTINCPGLSCFTDASASTDDHGVVGYAWDWGDGTVSTGGPTASHTYTYEGSYTVTLTVTDAPGQPNSTARYVEVWDTGAVAPTTPYFDATGTTNSVLLSWSGTTGGVGTITYRIQRRSTHNGAWGPEIVTTATSYTDTAVAYATMYEYRIKAVDTLGQFSDYNWNYAVTVVFGPNLPSGSTVLPVHIRDLRDATDAWRTFAGLAQVYPANPLPANAPNYAHLITDHSVEPLPGVVPSLAQAYSAIGWPSGIIGTFFGVPQPAPGVPVYPEHVNQMRELLLWW